MYKEGSLINENKIQPKHLAGLLESKAIEEVVAAAPGVPAAPADATEPAKEPKAPKK